MSDKTKFAISAAIDALGSGAPRKTNGKITAINIAREAGVSKATLYRYLGIYSDLAEEFEAVRSRGITTNDDAPVTVDDALAHAKTEIVALRKLISNMKDAADKNDKLKSHQILVLWKENQRLNAYIERIESTQENSKMFAINGRGTGE